MALVSKSVLYNSDITGSGKENVDESDIVRVEISARSQSGKSFNMTKYCDLSELVALEASLKELFK